MSQIRRWNVEIHASEKTVWHYEDVSMLGIEDDRIEFTTPDGRRIITTLPYHLEEIK